MSIELVKQELQNQSSYMVNTTKQHKNDNDREYLQCILDGSV